MPSSETISNEAASVGGLFILKLVSRQCLLVAQSGQSDRTRLCPLGVRADKYERQP
jgi:hypothetical protein